MIEELWAALKAQLLAEGGYDRLTEFLSDAYAFAEIEEHLHAERSEEIVLQ